MTATARRPRLTDRGTDAQRRYALQVLVEHTDMGAAWEPMPDSLVSEWRHVLDRLDIDPDRGMPHIVEAVAMRRLRADADGDWTYEYPPECDTPQKRYDWAENTLADALHQLVPDVDGRALSPVTARILHAADEALRPDTRAARAGLTLAQRTTDFPEAGDAA